MGRVLGGSAAINNMYCYLTHQSVYDVIADATGDTSWGPKAMAKYYNEFLRDFPLYE